VTDFMSQRKFRDTGVYTEHYRPKRLEYILATWVPSERFAIGIGFHRDGQDFSDRERLLLELLRPHLIQAWRNTQVAAKMRERARLAGAFGALPVIVLGDGGRVVFVGERARRALERHFGGSERAQTIPEPILGWARRIRNAIGAEADEIPASAAPFVHDGAAGRIVIRAFTGDENIVLLIEAPQDPQRLAPLALTKREGEVLAWVAEGKTNEDIAMIVHCAPKTVEKHLEHIYQKLDVPNRAAAAAMAAVLLSEML
jgi:DNA-binding CsgD family transcriptional regulator